MGIRNLHIFLRKMCPHVYNRVPLQKYAFKKIAIDLSIYMCKFKTTYGKNWLDAFVHLMIVLRQNDIHFIFVYDSKAPPEKDEERRLRSEARARNKERIMKLQDSWDHYKTDHSDGIDLEDIREEHLYSFLRKIKDAPEKESNEFTFIRVEEELQKLHNSIFTITSEDFELTKELFQICKVPIMTAAGEAEATCAALNRIEKVSAVLTDDTDVLAYGAPIMLHRIQMEDETAIEIDYLEILESLKMTSSQFLDFCIMCGTDYNPNLPKIGPDRSYKLITQFGSLENIEKEFPTLPIHYLNYKRVREIFKMDILFDDMIPFCGFPDKDRLSTFSFVNNMKTNIENLISAFCMSSLHCFVLEEEKEEEIKDEEKKKSLLLLLNK